MMSELFREIDRRLYDAPDGLESGGAFNVIDDDLEDEEEKKRRRLAEQNGGGMASTASTSSDSVVSGSFVTPTTPLSSSGGEAMATAASDGDNGPTALDEEEEARRKAQNDKLAGIRHFDVSDYTRTESNYGGAAKLHSTITGESGVTTANELKRLAGLNDDDSWTKYINNGGAIPSGYEIESRLLLAEEKREDLYWMWKSGQMSESDFLYQAYGKDIMKKNGDDMSSVSWWFKRMDNGYWDSPLDSDAYLQDLLSESRAMFEADQKIKATQIKTFNWSDGESLNEKSFREFFGDQFTDEYINALGGIAQVQKMYNAGYLTGVVSPFKDANNDGKIGEGDWYYHDDGRVYKIGQGCKIERYSEDGTPLEVTVGNDTAVGAFFKRLFTGLFESVIGIIDTFIDLGAMLIGGIAGKGMEWANKVSTEREAWRNSLKIGDWAIINDNSWSADGKKSAQATAAEVGSVIGNITGMIVLTVLTAGAGGALKGAQLAATTTSKTVTQAVNAGMKTVQAAGKFSKVTKTIKSIRNIAKAGNSLGNAGKFTTRQAAKLFFKQAAELSKNGVKVLSGAAKAAGYMYTGAMVVGRAAARTTNILTHFGSGSPINVTSASNVSKAINPILKSWGRSAASSAILTSRDIIDNIANASAMNQVMYDPETGEKLEGWRSTGEIIGQAFAFGAINFGISTVLRATWDDVGITGRLASFGDSRFMALAKKGVDTAKKSYPIASALFRFGDTGSRWATLVDTLADSAEYVFTNVNNMYMQNGGFKNDTSYGNALREFLSNPASLIGLGYSSYATYAGGIGKTNYGSSERSGKFILDNLDEFTRTQQRNLNILADEIKAMPTDTTEQINLKQEKQRAFDDLSRAVSNLATAREVIMKDGTKINAIFNPEYGGPDGKVESVGYVFNRNAQFEVRYNEPEFANKITYFDSKGKKTKVYAANPNAEAGEISISKYETSVLKLIGFLRIEDAFSNIKNSKGERIFTNSKVEFLDKIILKATIAKVQTIAKTLGAYREGRRVLTEMLQSGEGQKKFFEKLKDRKEVMKGCYNMMYRGKKWQHLISELDTAKNDAMWMDIFDHPEKLFKTAHAFGAEFDEHQADLDSRFNTYFRNIDPSVDAAEKLLRYDPDKKKYEIDPTASKEVDDDFKIIEAAANQILEGDEGATELEMANFTIVKNADEMGSDWNSSEVQRTYNQIRNEVNSLKQLTVRFGDDDSRQTYWTQGGFSVFDVKLGESGKEKTYTVIVTLGSNDEATLARNNIFKHDAMTYMRMLSDKNLSVEKRVDAVLGLIETFVPKAELDRIKELGGDTSADERQSIMLTNKVRALSIIDTALKNDVLNAQDAFVMLSMFNINLSDFDDSSSIDGVQFSTAHKLFEANKSLLSVEASFAKIQKISDKVKLENAQNDFKWKVNDFINDIEKLRGKDIFDKIVSDDGGLISKETYDKLKKIKEEQNWDFYLSQATDRGSLLGGSNIRNLSQEQAEKIINTLFGKLGIKDYSEEIRNIEEDTTTVTRVVYDNVTDNNINAATERAADIQKKLNDIVPSVITDPSTAPDQVVLDIKNSIDEFVSKRDAASYTKMMDTLNEHIAHKENQKDIIVKLSNGEEQIIAQDVHWGMFDYNIGTREIINSKKNLLNTIYQRFPELQYTLDASVISEIERSASSPDVDFKTFKEYLIQRTSTKSMVDRYTNLLKQYNDVISNTQRIKRSNLCVINLAEFKTKAEQVMQMQADINVTNRTRTDDTVDDLARTVGGFYRIASSVIGLDNIATTMAGDPYVIFDFSNPADVSKCREFLKKFGYEKLSIEDIQGIEGVEYRPNDDNGFSVESTYDVNSEHDMLNMTTDKPTGEIRLDRKTSIYNIALNQFAMSDASLFDINTLMLVISDINGSARLFNGEVESIYDRHIKSGKVGGKAQQMFSVQTRGLSTSVTAEQNSRLKTFETVYALQQAYAYSAAFFADGYSQAREYPKIDNEARRTALKEIGFQFDNNNRCIGYEYSVESVKKAIETIQSKKENPLLYILPFDEKTATKFSNENVERFESLGFGRNLVREQDTYASVYENFLANEMLAGIESDSDNSYDPFRALMKLSTKDISEELTTKINFESITIPETVETVADLKKMLDNEKYKDNFYAQQLLAQINGLEILSDATSESEYRFLADSQIRNAILDNIDKTPEEIVDIIKKLKYKKKEKKSTTIDDFSEMYNRTFHSVGTATEKPSVNNEVYQSLGIRLSEDEFNAMKDRITSTQIKSLIESSVIRMESIAQSLHRISQDDNIFNVVSAILYRTKESYVDDKGNKKIRYNISLDDIAGLTKEQVTELTKRIGANETISKQIIDAHNDLTKLINSDIEYYLDPDHHLNPGEFVDTRANVPTNINAPSRPSHIIDTPGNEDSQALINRGYQAALRDAKKRTMKKMSSLYGNQNQLGISLSRYLSNNSITTNPGSRMMYDMNNSYQAARFLQSFASTKDEISELLNDKVKAHRNMDVDDFALRILASTTGVSSSDGYFGTFMFNEDGDRITMTEAVRTTANRDDNDTDSLIEYFKANHDKRNTVAMVVIDKNYAVESGHIEYIVVDDNMHNRLVDAFINKAVMRKRAEETEVEWIERQYPHLRIIKDIRDLVVKDLNLPKEIAPIIIPTAIQYAERFRTGGATLAETARAEMVAAYASLMDPAKLRGAVRPEDFDIAVNDQIKQINDVLKTGLSNNIIPPEIKGLISNLSQELCSREAVKAYRDFVESGITYAFEDGTITPKNIVQAAILNSNDAVFRSAAVRALAAYDMPKSSEDAGEGYAKLKQFQQEGYVIFDTEYIRDNKGRQTLVEISISRVDSTGKVYAEKKITLDSGVGTDPDKLANYSNYRKSMTTKLIKDGLNTEEANNYVDRMLHSTLSISDSTTTELSELATNAADTITKIISNFIGDSKNFITFNGTMRGADLDMIRSTKELAGFYDIVNSGNHLDAYRDLILQVIPDVVDIDGKRINLDLQNLSNTGLAKQLGIGTADAHNSDSDNKITVEVLNKLFAKKPISFMSPKDSLIEEVRPMIENFYPESPSNDEVFRVISEAIDEIKKAANSLNISDDSLRFIDGIVNYKGQTNINTRKVLESINALRIAQDEKTFKRLVDKTTNQAITQRLRERIDSIIPRYGEATNLIAYIAANGKAKDFYNRASAATKALSDMYGKLYPGSNSPTISMTDLLRAIDTIIANGDEDEFLRRVSAITKTTFSVEDMNQKQITYQEVNDMMAQISSAEIRQGENLSFEDRAMNNSIRLVNSDSNFTDEISTRFRTIALAQEVAHSKLFAEDEQTASDLIRYIVAKSNNLIVPDRKTSFIDNIQMQPQEVLSELSRLIIDEPGIYRSYSKAQALMPGTEVIDILGTKHTMDSNTVVISERMFKDIFGMSYQDMLNITGEDIYAFVERQPADKPDIMHPHKVVVVKGDDVTRVTPIDMFSRMAGDFDGDSLIVYKSTPEESALYGRVLNELSVTDTYKKLDSLIQTGMRHINDANVDADFLAVYKAIQNADIRKLMSEKLDEITSDMSAGFNERYEQAVEEIKEELGDEKYGTLNDSAKNEIIDALFLKRNKVGADTYTYIFRNEHASINPETRKILRKLNADARAYSATQSNVGALEPAITGYAEYKYLLDRDAVKSMNISDINLSYRPITLNAQMEMLLRLGVKNTEALASTDFDSFMTNLLDEENTYQKAKEAWFRDEIDSIQDVWNDGIKKNNARRLALDFYKAINDNMYRTSPKVRRGENILTRPVALNIANRIFNNSDSRVNIAEPKGIGDMWVFYPTKTSVDEAEGNNSQGNEHITQWDARRQYVYNFSVKVDDTSRYKEGDVIKKGTVIGGRELKDDALVERILPNGRIILYSAISGLHQGTKIVNGETLRGKNVISDQIVDITEDVKRRDIYSSFAERNGIKDDEIFGYSNEVQEISKFNNIPNPENIKIITDDDGNEIGIAIKGNIQVIEDYNQNASSVDEGYIDTYTRMNSIGSVDGLLFAGGIFARQEINQDGEITGLVIDPYLTQSARAIERGTYDSMIGRTDGTDLYQRCAIFSLLELARDKGMTADEYKAEIQFLKSSAAGGEDGILKIVQLLQKYFPNGLPDKLTPTQKVLLSKELLMQVAGVTYTGIDESNRTGIEAQRPSKGRIKETIPSEVGTHSLGQNRTTLNTALEDSGYLSSGKISTLELINLIANANGRGIIDDEHAIKFNKPMKETRKQQTDGALIYAQSGKFGLAGPPLQRLISAAAPISSGDDAIKITSDFDNDYSINTKEHNVDLKRGYLTRASKFKNLVDFFNGTKETAYDRAYTIRSTAKSGASIIEPHRTASLNDDLGIKIQDRLNIGEYDNAMWIGSAPETISSLNERAADRDGYKNPYMARMHSDHLLDEKTYASISSIDFGKKESEYQASILQEADRYIDVFKTESIRGIKRFTDSVSRNPQESLNISRINHGVRFEDTDVSNNVKKDKMYTYGMAYNDSETAEAMGELRRVTPDELNTPGVINDYNRITKNTMFNYAQEESELRYAMQLTGTTEYDVSKYMAVRGALEALEAVDTERTNHSEAELMKVFSTFDFSSKEEALAYVKQFEKDNPLVVTKSMVIVQNLSQLAKQVNKATNTPFDSFSLMLTMKPESQKEGAERLKQVIAQLFRRSKREDSRVAYKNDDVYSKVYSVIGNGFIDFFDNARCLTNDLARQQSIIRMAEKLPMNRRIVSELMNQFLFEKMENGEEQLGENSDKTIRGYQLSEISRQLGITLPVTDNASVDYRNALQAIDQYRSELIAEINKSRGDNPIDAHISYNDLVAEYKTGNQTELMSRAIAATEAQWQLYDSIVKTSPKIRKKILETLKAVNDSNHAIVDRLGRKIKFMKKDGDISVLRKPVGSFDVSYIRDAITDNINNREDYETTLCIRALAGDVCVVQKLLADKLDKHVFTYEIPNGMKKILQDSARFVSKVLMSQPIKIMRRLLQFSLYDFNMAMTANPWTFKEVPSAKRELSAFFQSKGAVCSAELKDYLEHQGFKYSDIKGYDPVQMESAGGSNIFDRMYFDKVNNMFSMQNLIIRYSLYRAEKKSFDEGRGWYGVMYHKKDVIDGMKDSGNKAMAVIDATLGGPGGFSELSRDLGKYGFTFTTFPLAVARWAKEGASTAKALLTNIGEAGFGDVWKHLGSPIVAMGATYAITYAITMWLAQLFGVDEEDAKKMALNQEFIDPFQTIWNNGIVTVSDNSVFQLQAIIDSFDSFREQKGFGNQVIGFLNDNFLSHINPIFKAVGESAIKKDFIGSSIIENDRSFTENVERKALGYFIGSAGANAFLDGREEPNSTLTGRISNALAAEIGNDKAYKSDKKSYQKTLSQINSYLSNYYKQKGTTYYDNPNDQNKVYSLTNDIKKAIDDSKGMEYVAELCARASSKGYSKSEITSAIKACSVQGKIERMKDLGIAESFYASLSESQKNMLTKAIAYEDAYFPYSNELLGEEERSSRTYYSSKGYLPHIYLQNHYVPTPSSRRFTTVKYQQPVYFGNAKTYGGTEMPDIKKLFINKLTNTTGSRAITIADLIGEYWDNYYSDYKGSIDGEKYKEHWNGKKGQSDWRN